MRYEFLSDEWFDKVDELIARAGNLDIPEAMRQAEVNVTVVSARGETQLHMKDGLFYRGHQPSMPTRLTLGADLARRIFVDGDVTAGVQGFLEGQIKVEGDLASVVKLQTTLPSEAQKRLTREIAAITA
jgi:putative sterol carrier protein